MGGIETGEFPLPSYLPHRPTNQRFGDGWTRCSQRIPSIRVRRFPLAVASDGVQQLNNRRLLLFRPLHKSQPLAIRDDFVRTTLRGLKRLRRRTILSSARTLALFALDSVHATYNLARSKSHTLSSRSSGASPDLAHAATHPPLPIYDSEKICPLIDSLPAVQEQLFSDCRASTQGASPHTCRTKSRTRTPSALAIFTIDVSEHSILPRSTSP